MSRIERLRQAERRGWHVVRANVSSDDYKQWADVVKWCERNINGYYVCSYSLGKFAFEQGKDATWFLLKWS